MDTQKRHVVIYIFLEVLMEQEVLDKTVLYYRDNGLEPLLDIKLFLTELTFLIYLSHRLLKDSRYLLLVERLIYILQYA